MRDVLLMNADLARLLGWANVFAAGGALLGAPPAGERACRGQALVPDWAGSWAVAGPLAGEHEIRISLMTEGVEVGGIYERYVDHASRDAAACYAITQAVAAKLRRERAMRLRDRP